MNGEFGHSEKLPQREPPAELDVDRLKSASEVREVVDMVGGHNLLNEHALLEGSPSEHGKWLENVQSGVIDAQGVALAIKEGGSVVGFVLADHEGLITQFRSVPGKEAIVLEHATRLLKDKGIERPKVRLTEKSETMRHVLHTAGFHEKREEEGSKHGKILMEKE